MPAGSEEKTEQPTSRRLQDAREKGQVAKSNDLGAAVGLLVGLIMLNVYGPSILKGFMQIIRKSLTLENSAITGQLALDECWRIGIRHAWAILGPVFMVMMVTAIVINLLQVGFMLVSKPITPSLEKISPLSGFKRLFSPPKLNV